LQDERLRSLRTVNDIAKKHDDKSSHYYYSSSVVSSTTTTALSIILMADTTSATIRTITHSASGASLRIHPFGATVIGYTDANGREVIFVSKLAKLDGSAPIRGGIPIVFPIFGPPPPTSSSTMPQHGYARRNVWNYAGTFDEPDRAGVTFELPFSPTLDGLGGGNDWSDGRHSCTLILTAECTAHTLTTTLQVHNTGLSAFPFQALQHTYLAIPRRRAAAAAEEPVSCRVTGLAGYAVTDKVAGAASPHVSDVAAIAIGGSEIDRVYDPPTPDNDDETRNDVHVTVWSGGGAGMNDEEDEVLVELMATAAVHGQPCPVSCVVWNPHVEKAHAMADFGDDEYQTMVCVEPGILNEQAFLEMGQTATLTQTIRTMP
jgi:glucose-6-phosphate 1-epimerase